jgi:hypothetical protein
MASMQSQLEAAVSHHQAGRFSEAEAIYRRILADHPDHVGAMILLGTLSIQAGR